MAIAYKSQGAGASTETSGAALSPACPATVDAGDILIAHVFWEGTTTAPSTPSGWDLLHGPEVIETTVARHWVFGKIADGSEDGASVDFGSPAVTTQRGARVYSFSGRVSGTITQLVRGFAATSHATDPQMPSVTTTAAGAMAVALVAQNDNNAFASPTGETGGDWVEAVAEYTVALTPGLSLGIETCIPTADPGTVSGGSMATSNDPCGVIGFEIRTTQEIVTVTPDPVAASFTATTPTVVYIPFHPGPSFVLTGGPRRSRQTRSRFGSPLHIVSPVLLDGNTFGVHRERVYILGRRHGRFLGRRRPASDPIQHTRVAPVPGGATVTPDPVAAVFTTTTPVVIQTSLPAPVVAAFSATTPTVVLGTVTLTPSPVVATFTTTTPTVVLGTVTLTPSSTVAVFATPAPTVVLGTVTLAPAAVVATFSTTTPIIITDKPPSHVSVLASRFRKLIQRTTPAIIRAPLLVPAIERLARSTVWVLTSRAARIRRFKRPPVIFARPSPQPTGTLAPPPVVASFTTTTPTVLGGATAARQAVFVFGSRVRVERKRQRQRQNALTSTITYLETIIEAPRHVLRVLASRVRGERLDRRRRQNALQVRITRLVAQPGVITPSPIVATFSATTPTVVRGSITLSPAPVVAAFTTTTPTVSNIRVVTPDPVAAVFTTTTPVVIKIRTITPAAAVAAFSATTPTLNIGARTLLPSPTVAIFGVPLPILVVGELAGPVDGPTFTRRIGVPPRTEYIGELVSPMTRHIGRPTRTEEI